MGRRKIAIACQGGGSHAAFAAGLLRRLLLEHGDDIEIIGLSGTSGGAICAALAWAGLIRGGAGEAADRLLRFWEIAKADTPLDYASNALGLFFGRLPFVSETSPYDHPAPAAAIMRDWLEEALDIPALPTGAARGKVKLYIGATDVLSGVRSVFTGDLLAYEDLIASAAIPTLYEAVEAREKFHWDGLFSVNPPIRDLVFLDDLAELWVIQINPRECAVVPRSMNEIIDRRNELSGNISLEQELHLVETLNKVVAENPKLDIRVNERALREIPIRVVEAKLQDYDYASKLDRSPQFIDRLMALGAEQAAEFFDARSQWPRPDGGPHTRSVTVEGPSAAVAQAAVQARQQPAATSVEPAMARLKRGKPG
ncbi:patatin-like phospholipase family protein [Bosea sp. 117]|uniref:patatin-like phospholipase family protein n=1 Tax=Bosea sp. 117 TaxID=1125973 RepID=UPI0009DFEA57|nr:patatin-like phospholipase family protein [Bosea sp. 117]